MAETAIKKTKERNTGLDLLRCIAMMMIVVLHYLGKGKLLPDLGQAESWTATGLTAWVMETFCIVAVNLYMLISGYVLCESHFKLSRLISLYLQMWFYSVGVGMICQVAGLVPAEEITTYNYLVQLLPVSMGHYWFMTAYMYFFLILPLVGLACRKMSRKSLKLSIVFMLVAHSVIKSVLPVKLEMDGEGYDFMWYTILFLVAAYIKLYQPEFFRKRNCAILYVVGTLGAFAELLVLGMVGIKYNGALELIRTVSMNYNHIFVFLAALGLFGLFKDIRLKGAFAKFISGISVYTLGVYLIHENIRPRYLWQLWFKCDEISDVIQLISYTLLAVVVIFAFGIAIDFLRDLLFKGLHNLFKLLPPYKKLCDFVSKTDNCFAQDK